MGAQPGFQPCLQACLQVCFETMRTVRRVAQTASRTRLAVLQDVLRTAGVMGTMDAMRTRVTLVWDRHVAGGAY